MISVVMFWIQLEYSWIQFQQTKLTLNDGPDFSWSEGFAQNQEDHLQIGDMVVSFSINNILKLE